MIFLTYPAKKLNFLSFLESAALTRSASPQHGCADRRLRALGALIAKGNTGAKHRTTGKHSPERGRRTLNVRLVALPPPSARLAKPCFVQQSTRHGNQQIALLAHLPHSVIEAGLSDYYLVEEVQATDRGMAIALPTLL